MTFLQVRRFWAEISGQDEDQLTQRAPLDRQHGADAIGMAKLIIACERAFGISIFDEDVSDFDTLQAVSDYIDGKLQDGRDDYTLPGDQKREAWYYE